MKTKLNERTSQIFKYLKKLSKDLKKDQLPYEEINIKITDGIALKGSPLLILIFSSLIASIGLNINSLGVILGAKLISPIILMIFGMSFGIATYQFKLTRKSLIFFFVQLFIIIVTSTLYFLISPIKLPTDELVSKTTVTIFDIMLALFGGSAAAIATTRNEKYNVLPGVALVTSLLPAVCTIGYGIANKNIYFILGALYLYTVNVVFLMFSFFLFFKLITMGQFSVPPKYQFKQYLFVVYVILAIIPILYSTGINVFSTYSNVLAKSNYHNFVTSEFTYENTVLIDSNIDTENKIIKMLLIGEALSLSEKENLTKKLKNYNLEIYEIVLIQDKEEVYFELAKDKFESEYKSFDNIFN